MSTLKPVKIGDRIRIRGTVAVCKCVWRPPVDDRRPARYMVRIVQPYAVHNPMVPHYVTWFTTCPINAGTWIMRATATVVHDKFSRPGNVNVKNLRRPYRTAQALART